MTSGESVPTVLARPAISSAASEVTPDQVQQVRDGDERAARELVEALYPMVIRIVRAHLPRRAAEEDLAQEIFVKMFHHLDQYQGVVPFAHWVSRIAVNHCRNAIRAQIARPEWRMADLSDDAAQLLDYLGHDASPEPVPADGMEAAELVERLLAELEPRDRALLRWMEMEDWTIEEIARHTGWSSTLIRVRAFRARRKLNARFGQLRKEGKL